jgi:hypothetical protein
MAKSSERSLTLHYSSSTYRVAFYAQTPRDEMLAGIREVLGLPPAAPVRFRNAAGDVVLISSSAPSGTELHVTVESGAPHIPALQSVDASRGVTKLGWAATAPNGYRTGDNHIQDR